MARTNDNGIFFILGLLKYQEWITILLPLTLKSMEKFRLKQMSISLELLEILRCPKCKSKVELKPDGSGLKCTNHECALVYPVRDDIPVMLIDEATTEK